MADTIHQVSFVDVKESYPPGSSIQCRYVVKGPHVCSSKDWIGIYRVGWRSCNNYEAYVWVQMPSATDESQEVECGGTVTFPADSLPSDSRDFYQFCYISSASQVCGVSAPFQMCASVDDLFEVQDPDDPTTMVIKTRAQVLEEQVGALKKERLELQKETQLLHCELDAERTSKGQLMNQLQLLSELQDQLNKERDNNRILNENLKELQETLQSERQANEQLHGQIRGMRDELKTERKVREESLNQPLDVPDGIKATARISDTDEDADLMKNSFASASPGGDTESKQMSLTERITGSVLKHLKKASDWLAEDFDDDQMLEAEPGIPAAAAKPEPSLSLCPVCNFDFLNLSEREITAHIDGHNGPVCPICYTQFDKSSDDDVIAAHINNCLENPKDILSF